MSRPIPKGFVPPAVALMAQIRKDVARMEKEGEPIQFGASGGFTAINVRTTPQQTSQAEVEARPTSEVEVTVKPTTTEHSTSTGNQGTLLTTTGHGYTGKKRGRPAGRKVRNRQFKVDKQGNDGKVRRGPGRPKGSKNKQKGVGLEDILDDGTEGYAGFDSQDVPDNGTEGYVGSDSQDNWIMNLNARSGGYRS